MPGRAEHAPSLDAAERPGLRLFLAVEVPDEHRRSIERAIDPLRAQLPHARWTSPESWHITLRFFGEVPEDRVAPLASSIAEAVRGTPVVTSRLTELGGFPSLRRARVLWVGITDPEGALANIASRLQDSWPEANPRPLHPHLTVARFKEPFRLGVVLDTVSFVLSDEPFAIGSATLYRSRLSRAGARYEELERFPFSLAQDDIVRIGL